MCVDVPGVNDVDRRGGAQGEDGWVHTDSYKSCAYLLGVVGAYVSTLIIYLILGLVQAIESYRL